MTSNIDQIRTNTLKQIETTERNYKLAYVAAAGVEFLFFAGFIMLADFSNRSHLLLFISVIALYTIIAAGLFALGAHVNRNTLRIIRAIEKN
jgi:hypothetical protein